MTRDDDIDVSLLLAVASGQEQAFVDLYARRRPDVYRFAFAMVRSRAVAQDVTQEVFLNVLENAARYVPARGSARAWLLGCARHLILDRLRAERRWTHELPEPGAVEGSDEALFAEQRVARLHAAVARLPVEYREAVVLCALAELSYAETAVVLDCPVGTVRSRLHRGRALLASMLTGDADPGLATPPALRAREVYP